MNYKILLADDSITILEVMTFAFENNGFDITVASSSQEVKEKINKNSFDVIIIDDSLEKEDLILFIKTSSVNFNSYVFIISEDTDSISKHEAKKLGASGWIIKPFIPEKLVKTIKNFLISQ